MDWYHAQITVANLGINQHIAEWLILPSDIQENLTDPTLMAIRAFLNMRTTSECCFTGFGGFAGIGVIAWNYVDDNVPLDIPQVLSPDGDMDWIARWIGVAPMTTPAGTNLNPNIFDNTHLNKARRRLGNDRSLLVVFETVDISANYAIDLRALIKE
jgi:hypothetical protein